MVCNQKTAKVIISSNNCLKNAILDLKSLKSRMKNASTNFSDIRKRDKKKSEELAMQLEESEMDVAEFIFDVENDLKIFEDLKKKLWNTIRSKKLRAIAKGTK